MKRSVEQVLDICLAQLNRGMGLEQVISAYPDLADELRPLLAAAVLSRVDVPPPRRREANKAAFLAAVADRRRQVADTDRRVASLKLGVPIGELLADAPAELRPALHAAWRMHVTALPESGTRGAGKRRVMAMAARRRLALAPTTPVWRWLREAAGDLVAGLTPAPTATRRAYSTALATMAATMLLVVGMAGLSTAAADTVPGEAFYRVKRLSESAQLFFAFDPQQRANLSERFSTRRLREMAELADGGQPVPSSLVADWVRGQSGARIAADQLSSAEQRVLAEALLGVGPQDRLLSVIRDRDAVDELLAWARKIAVPAPEPAGAPTPVVSEAPVLSVPMPGPRPLPPEDVDAQAEQDDETPLPVVTAVPVAQPPAPEPPEKAEAEVPAVVQPANVDTGEGAKRRSAGQGEAAEAPGSSAPVEPPKETPAAEPPPYIQPPIGGSTPSPDPGDGGGDAGGVELPTPEP